MAGRRRRVPSRLVAADASAAVLGFANVVAGVLDFLGAVAADEDPNRAGRRAVRRARSRARAIRDAEEAVLALDRDEDPV